MTPWVALSVFLVLAAVGVWTWFGPLGQAPAQIGPGWEFLLGLGLGLVGFLGSLATALVLILR